MVGNRRGGGANGFLWQEVSVAATFLAATRSRPTTLSATRTACAQTLLKLPDVFFTVGELWIDLQRGGQLRGRLRHVLQTGKDHRCVPAQFHVVRRGADGHAQRPRRIVVFPEQVLNPAERVEDIRLALRNGDGPFRQGQRFLRRTTIDGQDVGQIVQRHDLVRRVGANAAIYLNGPLDRAFLLGLHAEQDVRGPAPRGEAPGRV